jgi:hypothetical protein
MMDIDTPETCRGLRNTLKISCASSWFFFTRLYQDARSTIHKKTEKFLVDDKLGSSEFHFSVRDILKSVTTAANLRTINMALHSILFVHVTKCIYLHKFYEQK